jgi:hypothetical protein
MIGGYANDTNQVTVCSLGGFGKSKGLEPTLDGSCDGKARQGVGKEQLLSDLMGHDDFNHIIKPAVHAPGRKVASADVCLASACFLHAQKPDVAVEVSVADIFEKVFQFVVR